jgi:hypothetical protein
MIAFGNLKRNVEDVFVAYFKELSRHSHVETEKKYENPQSGQSQPIIEKGNFRIRVGSHLAR